MSQIAIIVYRHYPDIDYYLWLCPRIRSAISLPKMERAAVQMNPNLEF